MQYQGWVVYRTIPTSNHNRLSLRLFISLLYIVLFLHQTTTGGYLCGTLSGCISYYSYIKPQLGALPERVKLRCISYYSYIKPQPERCDVQYVSVVYRTIPTSNHNRGLSLRYPVRLYIVLFLHQTTTWGPAGTGKTTLYIVLFLHQTTT